MSGVCFLRQRYLHNSSWPVKLYKLWGRIGDEQGRDWSNELYIVWPKELFHWDDKYCVLFLLGRLLHRNNVDGSHFLHSLRVGQI